jgi:predicted acetyltransferase
MAELIAPTVRLRVAWLEARDEWGPGVHQDGAGLWPGDDVDSAEGFAAWVNRLNDDDDGERAATEKWVPCVYRWMVEGDQVLGTIALRLELNDFLLRAGGHIGYGVRPSARRRGLATWALGEMLGEAGARGLDRVLVTCNVANPASARTIEKHGGVLEDVRDTEIGTVKRYWIELAA